MVSSIHWMGYSKRLQPPSKVRWIQPLRLPLLLLGNRPGCWLPRWSKRGQPPGSPQPRDCQQAHRKTERISAYGNMVRLSRVWGPHDDHAYDAEEHVHHRPPDEVGVGRPHIRHDRRDKRDQPGKLRIEDVLAVLRRNRSVRRYTDHCNGDCCQREWIANDVSDTEAASTTIAAMAIWFHGPIHLPKRWRMKRAVWWHRGAPNRLWGLVVCAAEDRLRDEGWMNINLSWPDEREKSTQAG